MATLEWSPLLADDLPELQSLARACLASDGGLPTLADPDTLTALFLVGSSIAGRDDSGDIVAAAAVSLDPRFGHVATGLVRPGARNQGHGEALVKWAREIIGMRPVRVRMESVAAETDEVMRLAGVARVFSETVMRHDLSTIPRIPRPDGVTAHPYSAETARAFHTAYVRSFGERPGFPDTSFEEWSGWLAEDPDFLPERSRVALDPTGEPVGFVTVSRDWIDQVGTVPKWRGRGLGAHLMVRSLRALRKAGSEQVWLCVNVDNPSAELLYERLGFVRHGLRARYEG